MSDHQAIEYRDIRVAHSESLPALLAQLRLTLLISTYQTGHLVRVSARDGRLLLSFHQFEHAMGVAVKPGSIAVCTRGQVWFLRDTPDIAAKLEPRGQYDACYQARTSHFTDECRAHEAAWVGDEFWFVNTLFSCLAALHPYYSFAPRWRPAFITALRPEDRCHLNGLALQDGRPRYLTALGEADTPHGWRASKASGGCLIDGPTGQPVIRGLSLPHSPRLAGGRLYLLSSGLGRLEQAEPASGRLDTVAELPGLTRGLAIHGGHAFVGLSKVRPTLEGVPIVDRRDQLKCGVAVVELRTGQRVGLLEFQTTVEEVFDVQVLPGIVMPHFSGPWTERDAGQPFWTIPPARS